MGRPASADLVSGAGHLSVRQRVRHQLVTCVKKRVEIIRQIDRAIEVRFEERRHGHGMPISVALLQFGIIESDMVGRTDRLQDILSGAEATSSHARPPGEADWIGDP